MSFVRSFSGIALALVVGYAAGALMCVDAYHLGQASVAKAELLGPEPICLPSQPMSPTPSLPILVSAVPAQGVSLSSRNEFILSIESERTP